MSLNCGPNYSEIVVGAGATAKTLEDAIAQARQKARALIRPNLDQQYNKPCPKNCPNKTRYKAKIREIEASADWDPETGTYEGYVAYHIRGRVDCS